MLQRIHNEPKHPHLTVRSLPQDARVTIWGRLASGNSIPRVIEAEVITPLSIQDLAKEAGKETASDNAGFHTILFYMFLSGSVAALGGLLLWRRLKSIASSHLPPSLPPPVSL